MEKAPFIFKPSHIKFDRIRAQPALVPPDVYAPDANKWVQHADLIEIIVPLFNFGHEAKDYAHYLVEHLKKQEITVDHVRQDHRTDDTLGLVVPKESLEAAIASIRDLEGTLDVEVPSGSVSGVTFGVPTRFFRK